MLKKTLIGFAVIFVVGYLALFLASRTSRTVYVSRIFDAPIDRVWANFTDGDTMKRWWSPKGYTAPIIKSDFRVGGQFLYSMKSPTGDMHYNTGTYTDILVNKKILSKMSFADETGKPITATAAGLPGKWPMEVEILVEFEELGEQTKVSITETGIPLIMSVFAKMGWEQQFDKFNDIVAPAK